MDKTTVLKNVFTDYIYNLWMWNKFDSEHPEIKISIGHVFHFVVCYQHLYLSVSQTVLNIFMYSLSKYVPGANNMFQ